jgi:predicted SnoaL-like aldol condensation-catalyzing enzyme
MQRLNRFRSFIGLGLSFVTLLADVPPASAHDTRAEAANKKIVLDFYQALNDADAAGNTKVRIQGIAEKYLSPEYVQHAEMFANLPGSGSGRDKLIRMFQSMPAMKLAPPKTLAVIAEGDLVMMLTAREMAGQATGPAKPALIFNMFRVKNGRLTEHWDIMPQPPGGGGPGMPPPSGMMPPNATQPPGRGQ